jgi:hypothetical protein
MLAANFDIGESFKVQFVWRLPDNDYIRAIFEAEVLHKDHVSGKYVVRLVKFEAGRQEDSRGDLRPVEEAAREYWAMVDQLVGRKISVAFEADDSRPLWLRLETLTGEHNFFRRLNELPPEFPSGKLPPGFPPELAAKLAERRREE